MAGPCIRITREYSLCFGLFCMSRLCLFTDLPIKCLVIPNTSTRWPTNTHTYTNTHKKTHTCVHKMGVEWEYSRQGFVVVQLICWLGAESIVSANQSPVGTVQQSSCGPGCIHYGVLAWRHYVLWSPFSTSSPNLRYCYVLHQWIYLFCNFFT